MSNDNNWINDLIHFSTLAFAILSLIGDIYVLASTRELKIQLTLQYGRSARLTPDYIIYHLIFMMALLDGLYIIGIIGTNCIDWHTQNTFCVVCGFIGLFTALMVSLWRLLVPGYLFYLLSTDNQHQKKIYSPEAQNNSKASAMNEFCFDTALLLFMILSFIGSIIPLFWNNKNYYGIIYNYSKNGINYGSQCYVTGDFILVAYIIRILSILLDVAALIFSICKYNQTKWYTNAYLILIKRLSAWVFVFMIMRLVPFVDRLIFYIIDQSSAPLWLVLLEHYFLASTGIANAFVWNYNRRVKPQKVSDASGQNGAKNNRDEDQIKHPLVEMEITSGAQSQTGTEQATRWQSFTTEEPK